MSCVVTKRQHILEKIYGTNEDSYGYKLVINWCIDCGAVVIDEEIDGRIRPGGYKGMKFPKSAFKYKGE